MIIYYLTKQGQPVDPNGKPMVIETFPEEQNPVTNDDDLTVIKGIGPARAKELAQYGINNFQRLAVANLDDLSTAMEVSPAKLAEWQNEAATLVQS